MTAKLANPPIIEAVLDIDCDMPPSLDLGSLEEPARAAFGDRYPKSRAQLLSEARIEAPSDAPPRLAARRGLQALQFLQEDERQLVQVRASGFSFNRLAPYSSLDQYLPEIERTWRLFVDRVSPLQVRQIRLRYINRILLRMKGGSVTLGDYLAVGPRLPDEERLKFLEFLHRHVVVEAGTGNRVNTILASQPLEGSHLPVILDIEAVTDASIEPRDWPAILTRIGSLRSLKNLVFQRTLTKRCHRLFRSRRSS